MSHDTSMHYDFNMELPEALDEDNSSNNYIPKGDYACYINEIEEINKLKYNLIPTAPINIPKRR